MKKIPDSFAIALITFVAFLIFWQFFLKGYVPFPGDYLIAWFEPWKSDNLSNATLTIPHKPIADDIFRQLYPFKILGMNLIKNFQLPLWNPYNGAGMPLLATMHIGLLNPFNIFFLFLPDHIAWSIFIIIQPALIGIFTYLYCRKISLSTTASFFSAVSFVFSGFVVARSIYGDYGYAIISLPLLLYLIESYLKNKKTNLIFLLPLIILFLITSVQPQITFYILSFVTVYILFRSYNNKEDIYKKNIFFLFALIVIGILFASIQLLPTLELYLLANINPHSSRFIFEKFLLPPEHFLTIFIPNYFGNQATYNFWGFGDYIETITTIGTIPCFFAFIGLLNRSKKLLRINVIFCTTILVTLLLTVEWMGTKLLYSLPLPIIATSIPSRILFLTLFSITILAGFGFDAWINYKKELRKIISISILPVTLPFLILLITFISKYINVTCSNKFIPLCREIALRNTMLEIIFFSVAVCAFYLYLIINKKSIKKVLLISIPLLVITIGMYNSNKFLPFAKKERVLPSNQLLSALNKHTTDGRVFGIDEAGINTDFATHFHFYDPNYYDPLYIKRYGELVAFGSKKLLSRSDIEIENAATLSASLQFKRDRLLNLLAVKYFIFKNDQSFLFNKSVVIWKNNTWTITKNTQALPHFFLTDNYEIISDDKKILNRLFSQSFNSKTTVLTEHPIPLKNDIKNEFNIGRVGVKNYQPNTLSFEVDTPKDQILSVLDNYYPGWKAYINDKETKIFRINYAFRGIVVPQGKHNVTFIYYPDSLKYGIYISSFSGALYLAFILWIIRNRRLIRK